MNAREKLLHEQQCLPLDEKVKYSKSIIKGWYKHFNGEAYISFSGGKDSGVLLHLVRSLYPEVPAVFADTGLEYSQLKEIVNNTENMVTIRPKMSFRAVVEKYGWPVVSKRIAQYVYEAKTTKSAVLRKLRVSGIGRDGRKRPFAKISDKWLYLIDAPFKISGKCCDVMKKNPFIKYEKETGRKGFLGILVSESRNRELRYIQHGCNAYNLKRPFSTPIAFWETQDILEYTKKNNIPLASPYGEIKENADGDLYLTGIKSTGCLWCGFGAHLEGEPNRFQQMKHTHPNQWDYVINKMGMKEALDYVNINYE